MPPSQKNNLKTIESTFITIGGDKCTLGLSLLDEVYFCQQTLKKLKAKIKKTGEVDVMSQGSYSIVRENPALKSYNTLIKNYQTLIKQINDLLGDAPKNEELDPLEEFNK